MSLGLRPTSVPSGIMTIQSFVHNRHEPKIEGLCPCPLGGWVPSNTMWQGLRPTSMPSFILIHPTVWPQYTNVTDRTDRQRSDNTGQTVLQTVTQKLCLQQKGHKKQIVKSAVIKTRIPSCAKLAAQLRLQLMAQCTYCCSHTRPSHLWLMHPFS